MLRCVLALIATPRNQEQTGQGVDQTERRQRVQADPQTRILHNDNGLFAGHIGSRRQAHRRVFTRLGNIATPFFERGNHPLDQRAGHPSEKVEAGIPEVLHKLGSANHESLLGSLGSLGPTQETLGLKRLNRLKRLKRLNRLI